MHCAQHIASTQRNVHHLELENSFIALGKNARFPKSDRNRWVAPIFEKRKKQIGDPIVKPISNTLRNLAMKHMS